MTDSVIVREVTGSARSITLSNRALPYRPTSWTGTQHFKKTWYPGNPEATIQILGPREEETEMRGFWKSRFIGEDVDLEGFDELVTAGTLITAETVVAAFEKVRRAANELEVRWGPEVRRGILRSFSKNYHNINDIEWTAMFEWSKIGVRPQPVAGGVVAPAQDLNTSMLLLDEILSKIPIGLLPNVTAPIRAATILVRNSVVNVNLSLANVFGLPEIPFQARQNLETLIKQLLDEAETGRDLVINGPYLPFLPVDVASKVLEVEVWRRDMGNGFLGVQTAALNARDDVRKRSMPGTITTVTVKQNQTLKDIALEFFGNADDWTVIADANRLTSAIVARGTTIVIPRAPETGTSIRIQS